MINSLVLEILEDLNLDQNSSIDDIIRFLHFKRNYIECSDDLLNNLVNLYKLSKDIRLFNEILWLSKKNKKIYQKAIDFFYLSINENGTYKFFSNNNLNKKTNIKLKNRDYDINDLKDKSVCLIGNPLFFLSAYKFLISNQINVNIVNILFHPNKFLYFIFYNRLMLAFYKLFYKSHYFEIKIRKKQDLKNITLNRRYDLGFHKMNFIIKDELISCFKKGLLNDHWGQLPIFKGRSTLEYSKLFGFKLLFTNHLFICSHYNNYDSNIFSFITTKY